MHLTLAQSKIAKDLHRFRVVNCGRRFGKTTLALYEMVGKAVSQKDRRIAFIATTYQQARDIAWRELVKICKNIIVKMNESRLELEIQTIDHGTSLISLRGWESIETARGQKFHFLVSDEVASMRNFWENWQEVLIPTLTDTKGEVLFLSTPKGYNHFFDLYLMEEKDKDWKSFHFTTYDNPVIETQEIEALKKQMTDDRFAQEYLADFRKVHGLVYPEFNRLVHIVDEKPKTRKERILGIDFGFTNPTAVLTIDVDFDNTYWIVDEWYKSGKTNIEVIEYSKSLNSNAVYPDPAEPDRCEEMKRHKLNVREVSKDVEAGINKVRELLKADQIKVLSHCKNVISEFESYSYPETKDDESPNELPIKENDHAMDALRYAVSMHSIVKQTHIVKSFKPNAQNSFSTKEDRDPTTHRVSHYYPKFT